LKKLIPRTMASCSACSVKEAAKKAVVEDSHLMTCVKATIGIHREAFRSANGDLEPGFRKFKARPNVDIAYVYWAVDDVVSFGGLPNVVKFTKKVQKEQEEQKEKAEDWRTQGTLTTSMSVMMRSGEMSETILKKLYNVMNKTKNGICTSFAGYAAYCLKFLTPPIDKFYCLKDHLDKKAVNAMKSLDKVDLETLGRVEVMGVKWVEEGGDRKQILGHCFAVIARSKDSDASFGKTKKREFGDWMKTWNKEARIVDLWGAACYGKQVVYYTDEFLNTELSPVDMSQVFSLEKAILVKEED